MRARNMQALTDAIKRRWPGVVVYGIGDAAHRDHPSDHNEDDTPGSRAAQSDGDSNPEHRAIDVMLGPAFTKADGDQLVASLLADPDARARLLNIIWYRGIWSRSWGWTRREYTGSDPHTNHPHISGLAADDENPAGWPAVYSGGSDILFCRQGATNDPATKALQVRLDNLGFYSGAIDGNYGSGTKASLRAACIAVNPKTGADGSVYDHNTMFYVDVLMARKYGASTPGPRGPQGIQGVAGPAGPEGPQGPQGLPGRDGLLVLPESVELVARIEPKA